MWPAGNINLVCANSQLNSRSELVNTLLHILHRVWKSRGKGEEGEGNHFNSLLRGVLICRVACDINQASFTEVPFN
jgi:hypothetical protein